MELPEDIRDTFERMIVPEVEERFLAQTHPSVYNPYQGVNAPGPKRLRKRRELTPFGFNFFNASIEVHPLSTEFAAERTFTRIRVLVLKGHQTWNAGIIEVNHPNLKEQDLDH